MLQNRYIDMRDKCSAESLASMTNDELTALQKQAIADVSYYRILELTVKRLGNSVYGAFGTPSNRYFLQALAEDICAEGQFYIKLMDKVTNAFFKGPEWRDDAEFVAELKLQSFGHMIPADLTHPLQIDETIDLCNYVDTDSTYTRGDVVLESLGIDINNNSNKDLVACIEYIFTHRMNVKFDKVLEEVITKRNGKNVMNFELEFIGGRGIFAAKKKYITTMLLRDGNYVGAKGWFKSTGIEIQQSGSSKVVHNIMKSLVNVIFTKWNTLDERTFFGICNSVRQQAAAMSIDDLAKINGLKTYDKYIICDREKTQFNSGASATVKGAARYNSLIFNNKLQNKYSYLKQGMRCRWFYTKGGGSFAYPEDVYPYEIMPEMDIDTQLNKLVFAPIKRLVDGMFKNASLHQMGRKDIQLGLGIAGKYSKNIKK